MTIENWDEFKRSIWDWQRLAPCFPRGILPTDIDGFVELNDRFLLIEGKKTGVPLKEGQRKTFERLFRLNRMVEGVFTIIVIWGNAKAGRVDRLQFWPSDPIDADWPQFMAYVQAWAEGTSGSGKSSEIRRTSPPLTPLQSSVHTPDDTAAERTCDQCGAAIYLGEEWFVRRGSQSVLCGDCYYIDNTFALKAERI